MGDDPYAKKNKLTGIEAKLFQKLTAGILTTRGRLPLLCSSDILEEVSASP